MTYMPVDVIIDQRAKERHRIDTLNLLAYVGLLVLVLVTTWFFKRRKRLYIHETGLAIIYGLVMGAALRYFGLEVTISSETLEALHPLSAPADYVTVQAHSLSDKNINQTHIYAYEFRGELKPPAKLGSQISYASVDPGVFFNIILPPIVLNAGLSLKRRHFFRNIGAIFSYAFLGTTISVAFVGTFLYGSIHLLKMLISYSYLADHFTIAHCLYFGAIISPTDPIAVLAIFQELGVDVNLFALVFGESILNDAVSIVLTHTIDQFSIIYGKDPYYPVLALIWSCIYNFLSMFCASCLIGMAFGTVTALTTKFTKLTESPLLETSLTILMSYSSFLTAEVLDASGIVAILLCGITQAHYTINNLSFEAREQLKNLFELLTFLCENFLFLAVGVCFWQRDQTWDLPFIGLAFIAITVARALSVYPLTLLLNLGRNNKIPANFQHLIAWGGAARGVISYSLAARNTVGDARRIMLSTTSVIVIVTVVSVGSAIGPLLGWLKIPFGAQLEPDKQARPFDEDSRNAGNSLGATNNPSWLVRPKRLMSDSCGYHPHGSNSQDAASHKHQQSTASSIGVAYTPSVCNGPKFRAHHHRRPHGHLHNNHTHHHHHHHHLNNQSQVSLEATPVFEVERAQRIRQEMQQSYNTDLDSQASFASCQPQLSILQEVEQQEFSSTSGGQQLDGDKRLAVGAQLETSGTSTTPCCDMMHRGDGLGEEEDCNDCDCFDDDRKTLERPYENASLVRCWRRVDNDFIKPLLTNSQPTLMETMPSALRALARLFTSEEQLMRQR